ncbi:GGDEF domain-containing protein [bacterium]|nr:GGDEF domain-containing protein [candidate division CSSED10-310 bacterium]
MMSGNDQNTPKYSQGETDVDRLRRTTTPDVMSVELVSAFSGDRDITRAESAFIGIQKDKRGIVFYSDLLYAVTHHYFAPEIAETLWGKILSHKHMMSQRLGRNVRIVVATIDYFSNITSELKSLTLISETYVTEIATLSMRDGMTGLFNHSSCYELLKLEVKNYHRYKTGLSLIMLDIDDFKSVNDKYGHQEGDRILIEFAKTMGDQVRDTDICCRLGGDEFITILPFTSGPGEALEIAERIRAKATSITYGGQRITISTGVAVCNQSTNSPQDLIKRADRALYRAKHNGKNQVIMDANL